MSNYKILNRQFFSSGEYSLVPIRYEDRYDIMKWRNEQIFHLRQTEPLTPEEQDRYFNTVIAKLFEETSPNQFLFSYLEGEKCIGYGGLVHINRTDRNAEISFIMDTAREKADFHKHWGIFLDLLEQIAFNELHLHKIYTYAFDLRPHLYEALEAKGFSREAILKEHCCFHGEYKNVVIHTKINHEITLRRMNKTDKEFVYHLANDELTRINSFNSSPISLEEHSLWFDKKMNDPDSIYYIAEIEGRPAGLIRFDVMNNHTTIGITIDKQARGQKLATTLLKTACNTASGIIRLPVYAYIKQNNTSSVKSFERAGFIRSRDIKINNSDSYEYILQQQ